VSEAANNAALRDRGNRDELASIRPSGRVVVVMSSIPSRLDDLPVALESIRTQTRVPDEVILSLPQFSSRENTQYSVPESLSALEAHRQLRILRTDRDYGPGTKILGPLDVIRDDDIVIVLDDDNWYEPFTVGVLATAIRSGLDAASFAVYERRGIRAGQGADGFAMAGGAARRMRAIIPLLDRERSVFLHDDYWMSFLLKRAGVTIHDVSGCLGDFGKVCCYRSVHSRNGLFQQDGPGGRDELNRTISKVLFRRAAPTPAMRANRAWAAVRAGSRGVRRAVGRR
jgi:hypothetical protein